MSTNTQPPEARAAAPDGATCRGRGGHCDRPTKRGDLCYRCVYDELVLDDPTICQRCFRRTHRIELVTTDNRYAAASGSLDYEVVDGVWRLEGEVYFRTPETEREVPPPKGDERPDEKTICRCGDVDGARRETLSRPLALDHAARLSTRLDEIGVEHDPEALLDVVDDRKHEPATAGKDQPTFREAVATAIETTD